VKLKVLESSEGYWIGNSCDKVSGGGLAILLLLSLVLLQYCSAAELFQYLLSGIEYLLSGIPYLLSGIQYLLSGIPYLLSEIQYLLSGIQYCCNRIIFQSLMLKC